MARSAEKKEVSVPAHLGKDGADRARFFEARTGPALMKENWPKITHCLNLV